MERPIYLTRYLRNLFIGLILIVVVTGSIVFRYSEYYDRWAIKRVLKGAANAVEDESIEDLMEYIAQDYHDSYGFDYSMVRRLMVKLFKDFEKFVVMIEDPVIEIVGDNASVEFRLWVLVNWQDHQAYIVGGNYKAANVRVLFKNGTSGWQVVGVEGVR